jgi:hypothetical protein
MISDPGRHERFVTVDDEGGEKAFIRGKTMTFFFLYLKSSEMGS